MTAINDIAPIMDPPWKIVSYLGRESLSGHTPEKQTEYEADIARWQKEYGALVAASRDAQTTALDAAVAALVALGMSDKASVPKSSRSAKTVTVSLREALLPFAPRIHVGAWGDGDRARNASYLVERTNKILEARRLEDAERERERKLDELRTDAIKWLVERGKEIGKDFSAANALEVANDIAFDEWAASMEGRTIDFSGQNCDGPCEGWTVGDHRCACGNRRVSWISTGNFKEPCGYAEAY